MDAEMPFRSTLWDTTKSEVVSGSPSFTHHAPPPTSWKPLLQAPHSLDPGEHSSLLEESHTDLANSSQTSTLQQAASAPSKSLGPQEFPRHTASLSLIAGDVQTSPVVSARQAPPQASPIRPKPCKHAPHCT